MKVSPVESIEGAFVVELPIFHDNRGFFTENFHQQRYYNNGIDITFHQDNFSFSNYGTIRGLHFQKSPHEQAKLVRSIAGTILDVIVDTRKNSPTFGNIFSIELTQENGKQLLAPAGVAHGFSVLSNEAIVYYKCDRLYHPQAETGIRYDDPTLNIDWKVPSTKVNVSDKDRKLPFLKDLAL